MNNMRNKPLAPITTCPECELWIFNPPRMRPGSEGHPVHLCERCGAVLQYSPAETARRIIEPVVRHEFGDKAYVVTRARADREGVGMRAIVEAHYGMNARDEGGEVQDEDALTRAHEKVMSEYLSLVPKNVRIEVTLLRLFE